tara:strand:- start:699 stop:893 length:195 start_codon:yes stop_codon:yes gene_type:complete
MTRRFDRNADQICQILGHLRLLQRRLQHPVPGNHDVMIQNAIVMLDALLDINDDLAKAVEKGVI